MNFKMLLLATLALSATQTVLSKTHVVCTDTTFSDIAKIEVIDDELTGSVTVVQYDGHGRSTFNRHNVESLLIGNFELSNWNGYSRSLVKDGPNDWTIEMSDECSGVSMSSVRCQEF